MEMKSLSRALTLLAELCRNDQPATLSDLSSSAGLHKSTTHRMLATFVEHGLVRRDEAHRYVLDLHTFELANTTGAQNGTVSRALTSLRDRTGERAHYAVPDADRPTLVTIAAVGGESTPGGQLPLSSTASGYAYLAYRPAAELKRRPSPALASALAGVRRHGYAYADRWLAAPVLDRQQHAVAVVSISVSNPVPGFDHLVAAVVECATELGGVRA